MVDGEKTMNGLQPSLLIRPAVVDGLDSVYPDALDWPGISSSRTSTTVLYTIRQASAALQESGEEKENVRE